MSETEKQTTPDSAKQAAIGPGIMLVIHVEDHR